MGVIESIRRDLREGAIDLLGLRGGVEALREAGAAATMASVALEDVRSGNLLNAEGREAYGLSRMVLDDKVREGYRYYFNDPLIKRGVDIKTLYVFGRGVSEPHYRKLDGQEGDGAELGIARPESGSENRQEAEEQRAKKVIRAFWTSPENQEALFGYQAQMMKDLELQLQANVFLLLSRPDSNLRGHGPAAQGEQPVVKISDVAWGEIVDVVTHPGNRRIVLFYKREWVPMAFDQISGEQVAGTPQMRYYRHWRNVDAPTEWEGKPWGPPAEQIDEKHVVYPVQTNKTSEMRFGIPELNSVLKWAKALNQYMTSRVAVVNLIAQLAFRVKGTGGPRRVSQAAAQLQNLTRLSNVMEESIDSTVSRTPMNAVKSRVVTESQGTSMEPMIQDTAAGSAQVDVTILKGHIAAGMGVALAHLGDTGQANLSSQTALDFPMLKLLESRQEMWRVHYVNLTGYAVEGAGLDGSRVDQKMPPILQRDVNQMMTAMAALLGAIDPNLASKKIIRWVFREVLQAMGEEHVEQTLDELVGDDYETPYQQRLEAEERQLVAQQAAAAPPGEPGASRPASRLGAAARRHEQTARRGLPRGADRVGGAGAAGAAARDRAAARHQRALEAGVPANLVETIVGVLGELDSWVEEGEIPDGEAIEEILAQGQTREGARVDRTDDRVVVPV